MCCPCNSRPEDRRLGRNKSSSDRELTHSGCLIIITAIRDCICPKVAITKVPNPWDDTEKVIDTLVHSCGDDSHAWESVGHRMHTHLCHEQGQQKDLVLRHIMVQEYTYSHHGRSTCGYCAVHQDHMVITDILGKPQVMEL